MNELKFSELGLIPEMQRAVDELGFEQTTDIQASAIPLLRTGADVIGRSQTGTGKTLAFAIPAIERIDREEAQPTPQVLILCPTRELAQQGCEEIKKLTRFMRDIWPVDVYGGAAMDRQIARLRRANLVIGTPGRIMDHMRRGTLSLANVKMVVLDEADEMLSMGFREDIETILKDVPEERQTVLFSATMPDAILELADQFLRDPQKIEINREQITLDNIRQLSMEVPMGRKLDALVLLLHAYDPKRCMIFCNTKLMVDEVSTHLNKSGFTCEAIHGDMNQSQRTRVMEGFKAARLPILVATDVAARGIDVSDVDYVVNYDIPQNSEYYVHRIGRQGGLRHLAVLRPPSVLPAARHRPGGQGRDHARAHPHRGADSRADGQEEPRPRAGQAARRRIRAQPGDGFPAAGIRLRPDHGRRRGLRPLLRPGRFHPSGHHLRTPQRRRLGLSQAGAEHRPPTARRAQPHRQRAGRARQHPRRGHRQNRDL